MCSEPSSYAVEQQKEGGYSLNSTDTDDQVTLAHRGLDRCAALLKSLLSPDCKSGRVQGSSCGDDKRDTGKEFSVAAASGKPSNSVLLNGKGKYRALKPNFPGALKHQHARGSHISTTPVVRHVRSKTDPMNVARFSRKPSSSATASTARTKAVHGLVRSGGKPQSRHRVRRRTDSVPDISGVSVTGKGSKAKVSHVGNGTTKCALGKSKTTPQVLTRAHQTCNLLEGTRNVPKEEVVARVSKEKSSTNTHCIAPTASNLQSASFHHYPVSHPSSLAHPAYHHRPYNPPHHPWMYLSHRFGQFTQPHGTTPQEACSGSGQSAIPAHTKVDVVTPTPLPGTSRKRRYSRVASDVLPRPRSAESAPTFQPPPRLLLPLIQEMQHSLQQSLKRLKVSVTPGLEEEVESLNRSQTQYHTQLASLCQQLGGSGESCWLSTADWLAQVQQLELERSHLLERVIQSEMAFSEARQELDKVRGDLSELRTEQETNSTQFVSVRNELLTATKVLDELRREKIEVDEALEDVTSLFGISERQLKEKNAALEHQVSVLEQQLLRSKEETAQSKEGLLTLKCSLEAAQEELELIRLSLSEKETEMLQAQDQMLGLRQCLAYFLSEPVKLTETKVPAAVQSGCCYCISEDVLKRFQSLVNDGNVNSFLAAYTVVASDDNPLNISAMQGDSSTPSPCCLSQEQESTPTLQMKKQSNLESRVTSDVLCKRLRSFGKDKFYKNARLGTLGSSPVTQLESGEPERLHAEETVSRSMVSDSGNVKNDDLQSMLTTSSEIEFQRDLASLDADIARLQIQFKVALQGTPY